MSQPAQSLDINVIENLWEILDNNIRNYKIMNKKNLKKDLLADWQKITPILHKSRFREIKVYYNFDNQNWLTKRRSKIFQFKVKTTFLWTWSELFNQTIKS